MGTAAEMDECIVRRLDADGDIAEEVVSLIRFGSFERGDFVPGLSDLDYFVVIESDEGVIDRVRDVLRNCAATVDHREIDVAWEYRANVGDPDAGVPFKFLTVYQDDFREHHTVVYGEDVAADLPDYDPAARLPDRADRIERLAEEKADDGRMLRIVAGETARMRAVLDGAESLRKDDVRATLEASDRSDASRVYEAYLSGRADELSTDFLERFIERQVSRMRAAAAGSDADSAER